MRLSAGSGSGRVNTLTATIEIKPRIRDHSDARAVVRHPQRARAETMELVHAPYRFARFQMTPTQNVKPTNGGMVTNVNGGGDDGGHQHAQGKASRCDCERRPARGATHLIG